MVEREGGGSWKRDAKEEEERGGLRAGANDRDRSMERERRRRGNVRETMFTLLPYLASNFNFVVYFWFA